MDHTGKPVLPENHKAVPDREQLEISYCPDEAAKPDEDRCFELDFDQGWMQPDEAAAAKALLCHPSRRTTEQCYAAALAQMTTQIKPGRKRKAFEAASLTREQKVSVWRAALGTKTIADRVQQLKPIASKGKRVKTAGGNKQKDSQEEAQLRYQAEKGSQEEGNQKGDSK